MNITLTPKVAHFGPEKAKRPQNQAKIKKWELKLPDKIKVVQLYK